jgi:hypothetical protein
MKKLAVISSPGPFQDDECTPFMNSWLYCTQSYLKYLLECLIWFYFHFKNNCLYSDLWLWYYFLDFFILCSPSVNRVLVSAFYHNTKRATTYHQWPNALSALDIYTMMSYQNFHSLCASQRSCQKPPYAHVEYGIGWGW